MKKAIAILLAVCMLFAFAACGDKEKATLTDAETTLADDTTVPETTEKEEDEPVKPEPVVLLDNEYLTLTINDAYVDEDNGYTLKATFENKGEKSYAYYIESASVDGVSVMNYFYADVNAGKKAVEDIVLEDELLRNNGLTGYTDIEMTVYIGSSDELFEEPVGEYTVHYYPQGADKAAKYVRQPAATDKVLIDNEYITVTAVGITHDDFFECADLNLYVVNKSEGEIGLDAESCSVNDIMMDSFLSETVPAGKSLFCSMSFDDAELEDKGITEIKDIEIEFAGYDTAVWLGYFENIDIEEITDEALEGLLGGDVDWLKDMYLFEETAVYEP